MKNEQEQLAIFSQRFLRSYRLLNVIAGRVLGGDDKAAIAIQNCWRTASRNPLHFEYEGAFRSWLLRVLIDEALAILRESHRTEDLAVSVGNIFPLSDNAIRPGLDKQERRRQWKLMSSKSRAGTFAKQMFQFLLSDLITF